MTTTATATALLDRIENSLKANGIVTCREWLVQCVQYLELQGPISNNLAEAVDKVANLFLDADLYEIACPTGALPQNIAEMHRQSLSGDPIVLQIDEVVNVAVSGSNIVSADKGKDGDNGSAAILGGPRMHKLCMTDGRRQVVGLEISPIPQLSVRTSVGTKIVIRQALVRRGAIMLTPQCAALLGGSVERLLTLQSQIAPPVADESDNNNNNNNNHRRLQQQQPAVAPIVAVQQQPPPSLLKATGQQQAAPMDREQHGGQLPVHGSGSEPKDGQSTIDHAGRLPSTSSTSRDRTTAQQQHPQEEGVGDDDYMLVPQIATGTAAAYGYNDDADHFDDHAMRYNNENEDEHQLLLQVSHQQQQQQQQRSNRYDHDADEICSSSGGTAMDIDNNNDDDVNEIDGHHHHDHPPQSYPSSSKRLSVEIIEPPPHHTIVPSHHTIVRSSLSAGAATSSGIVLSNNTTGTNNTNNSMPATAAATAARRSGSTTATSSNNNNKGGEIISLVEDDDCQTNNGYDNQYQHQHHDNEDLQPPPPIPSMIIVPDDPLPSLSPLSASTATTATATTTATAAIVSSTPPPYIPLSALSDLLSEDPSKAAAAASGYPLFASRFGLSLGLEQGLEQGLDGGVSSGSEGKFRFVVKGSALNISKFRVTAEVGYEVYLKLGEDPFDLSVTLGSDLCAQFLGQPATECAAYLNKFTKKEMKKAKVDICMKFLEFRGAFLAELIDPAATAAAAVSMVSSSAGDRDVDVSVTMMSPTPASSCKQVMLIDYYHE